VGKMRESIASTLRRGSKGAVMEEERLTLVVSPEDIHASRSTLDRRTDLDTAEEPFAQMRQAPRPKSLAAEMPIPLWLLPGQHDLQRVGGSRGRTLPDELDLFELPAASTPNRKQKRLQREQKRQQTIELHTQNRAGLGSRTLRSTQNIPGVKAASNRRCTIDTP
jgi:hypothetical protein